MRTISDKQHRGGEIGGKENVMGFSYKLLWKLLIDRDMPKKALYEVVGISRSTLDKMNRG